MKPTVSILSATLLVLTATFVRAAATISYSGAFLNSTDWRETDVAKTSSVDADGDNVIGDDGFVFLTGLALDAPWSNAAPAGLTVTTPTTGFRFPYGTINYMDSVFETPSANVPNIQHGQWRVGGSSSPTVFTITFNVAGSYLVTLFGDHAGAANATKWILTSGATTVERTLETDNGILDYYVFRVDGNANDVVSVKVYSPSSDDTRFGCIAFEEIPPQRGTLSFTADDYADSEGNAGTKDVTVTVSRTGGKDGAVSVNWATSDGTATQPGDYAAGSGTLNWANQDDANKTFTVTINGDTTVEGNETVNLTLSGAGGGATIVNGDATVTIQNDDATANGAIAFSSATYSKAEGNSGSDTVTITVTRTGGSSGAVGVTYATSDGTATQPGDYAAANGTLSWGIGDTGDKTFTVTINGDTTSEPNETVGLALSIPTGGANLGLQSNATLTIQNDDFGVLSFDSATYSQNEVKSGTVNKTITVTRTGVYGAVSVDYASSDGTATQPDDYTTASGTLNWADQDGASKTFTVTVKGDILDEDDETVNLTLSNQTPGATLGTAAAVLTIVDAGLLGVSLSIADTTLDEGQTVNVTATLDATYVSDVTVNLVFSGTANRPADYTCPATIVIPAGQLSKIEPLSVVSGDAAEYGESLTITIDSVTSPVVPAAPTSVTATILSQIPAQISYSGAFLDSTAWRETDVAKTSSVDADGDNVIGDDGYVFLSEFSTSAVWINNPPAGLTVTTPTSGQNYPYGSVNLMDSVFETPDDDVTNVQPGQWRTAGSGYPTVFTITFNSAGNYLVTLFGDISTAGANNNPTKWK